MNNIRSSSLSFHLYEPIKKYQEYVYMYYLYIKALSCKFVFEYLERINRKLMPFYIYKVYAYPANDLKKRIDISEDYFDGYTVTPTHKYPRIEYRCIWKSKKYKLNSIVDFKTDTKEIVEEDTVPILLPSITKINDPCLSHFTRKRTNVFIVQAFLCDETNCIDATKTLLKFAGPNQDFFQQPIITKWILKENQRYDYLQILYSNGKLVKYTMSEEISN